MGVTDRPHLILSRRASFDWGTFGEMRLPSGVLIYTVERPWLDNRLNVSCIPAGEYEVLPRRFFRGGYDACEVVGVKGRSHILFHVANWPREVEGCIAPNSRLGPGDWACPLRGYDSRRAFDRLMAETGGDFTLEIEP